MTTQKAQSKIKTSTIAITILSVLLAVAVASTIVLAAFATNKQATSTITFGGGLTIEVSNTSMNSSANWIVKSVNNAGTVGADITGNTGSLTSGAQFAAFTVKNTSDAPIAIAFQLTKTGTAALYVGDTPNEATALGTDNYNASGTAGTDALDTWFVITSVNADANANLTKAINSVYSSEKLTALGGGETATLTLKITAVFAGADANTQLADQIAAGTWATITTDDVATA